MLPRLMNRFFASDSEKVSNPYQLHPQLEYWVAEYGEAEPIAMEHFDHMVGCFFTEAQKPLAEGLTEDQKQDLMLVRGKLHHNDQLINYLAAMENNIVNAHRLPSDRSIVTLDKGIRAANQAVISDYQNRSELLRNEFMEKIAQHCGPLATLGMSGVTYC